MGKAHLTPSELENEVSLTSRDCGGRRRSEKTSRPTTRRCVAHLQLGVAVQKEGLMAVGI